MIGVRLEARVTLIGTFIHHSWMYVDCTFVPIDAYNPNVFSDRKEYDKAVADLEAQYQKKIQAEK